METNLSSKIRVYFVIKSEDNMNFFEINNLGLHSTKQCQKGESGSHIAESLHSYWEISSEKIATWDFESVSNIVIDKLNPKLNELAEIIKRNQYNCVLQGVVWVDINKNVTSPAISLNKKTISFLNKTGAIFDVDLYCYDSSNEV